ncbi:hypothetical protein GSU68_03040 [Rathayibacter sp. VKM Ac-2759]|uniref:hypothetical protein n=1 Tax=Rathayibacter sp. VKM Ac-2759 TaxID=2609252 RepID=UPI001318E723|nr:hypothetical protein [Rathayibacter sp. VKM Ac-2759]QHC65655.1 hypothetical protein GSU68_03040 [Rathayibacter sp. VKM Ac-2759]
MSNLGAYESFTTQAGSVGGVENLIEIIEKAAVSKSAPKLIAGGLAAGLVVAAGAHQLYRFGSAKILERKGRRAASEAAKDELRDTGEATDTD